MKRQLGMAILAGSLIVGGAATAGAQMYAWVGGGPSLAAGDTKDALKSGWLADAGIGKAVAGKLSLQLQASLGSSKSKIGDVKSTFYGGFVNLAYDLTSETKLTPYLYAGGGLLAGKAEGGESDSNGALNAGAGFSYKATSKVTLFGEVRYIKAGGDAKTTLMPILFGVSCPIGAAN